MKRTVVFTLVALFAVVFSASAQRITPEEIGKELYYDAIEAYEAGNFTKEQHRILRLTNYLDADTESPLRNSGGPDAFGYTWQDSEEPDGPTYNWIDISATGTSVIGDMGDDVIGGPYPIGFDFPYYGGSFNQFWIGSNGAINFDGEYITLANVQLPDAGHGAHIAIFNDDLDPGDAPDADVLYEVVNDGTQDILVISCINWDEFPGDADPDLQEDITMQYQLFADGTIQLHYSSVEAGIDISSSTIGIQNPTRDVGLTALYNGSIANYPYDGLAIEFAATPPNASLSGFVYDDDTNAPISGATVQVGFSSTTTDVSGFYEFTELYAGTYDYIVSAPDYTEDEGTLTINEGANTQDFFLVFFEAADILIFDGDPTPLSGPIVQTILEDAGFTVDYTTEWDSMPWLSYEAVFCFLGIFSNWYPVNTGDPLETQMVDYLNSGGNLFIEGGDFFGYDAPQNILAMLNLTNIADGGADLTNVMGSDGTFMEGANMAYTGENNWIDHISAAGGALDLLYNPADMAGCGVLDTSDPTWNSACFSFEVGGLQPDGDFTVAFLIEEMMTYWGMDPVPDPVEITLTGQTTEVPPGGGAIVYDVHLVSTIDLTFPGVQYWTEVVLPNGQTYGPLYQQPFTLMPFMDVTVVGLTQNVPAIAPSGTYEFYGYAGFFAGPFIFDSFEFTKIGVAADGIDNWNAGGNFTISGDETASVQLPKEYTLEQVYPNPFNPSANVTVALPEAADLSVTVFNVMGQQVAELTSGRLSAGTHNFIFDGSALSSGVYFVKAVVPGELNQIQKVTLMK